MGIADTLINLIASFGLGVGIVVWYLVWGKPAQEKREDSREQRYTSMITKYMDETREEHTAHLEELNVTLRQLQGLVKDDNKLSDRQSFFVLSLITGNTILNINQKMFSIIDNNSIVENINYIIKDIDVVISSEVAKGRELMLDCGIDKKLYETVTSHTDIIKKKAIDDISNLFMQVAKDLKYIEQSINDIEVRLRHEENDSATNQELMRMYVEERSSKKRNYIKLKRTVVSVTDDVQIKTCNALRNTCGI